MSSNAPIHKAMADKVLGKYDNITVGLPNDIEMFQDIQVLAQHVRQLELELATVRAISTTDMLLASISESRCMEN